MRGGICGHGETVITRSALEARDVELTPDQVRAVQKAAGVRVPSRRIRLWRANSGEAMFVDKVLGKHEFITYAVGLTASGQVKGIEIMDYRETYGGQIRDASWRDHFVGKSAADAVKLETDIPNISGATLSSRHVTDGVRRLLKTYEILQRQS